MPCSGLQIPRCPEQSPSLIRYTSSNDRHPETSSPIHLRSSTCKGAMHEESMRNCYSSALRAPEPSGVFFRLRRKMFRRRPRSGVGGLVSRSTVVVGRSWMDDDEQRLTNSNVQPVPRKTLNYLLKKKKILFPCCVSTHCHSILLSKLLAMSSSSDMDLPMKSEADGPPVQPPPSPSQQGE